ASPRNASASWLPWILAAASIALAAIAWVNRPGAAQPGTTTIAQQLNEFEQRPPTDLVRIAWAGQPDPLVTEGLSGEVLWSQSEQRGYMKFSGLRANDPSVEQYQLWIFDGSREHPVDGGVFDIDDEGNAIIPINAKLAVRQPTLFAVTVEKPGGVVVSNKERIAVVAPVEKG
ncbi:MAG: anti-sigma factor, partial [Phycisphaerales bacterium]|nr:anti-sigma factor [Phycisphaerales bacterium]